jgi:hypothetical protein
MITEYNMEGRRRKICTFKQYIRPYEYAHIHTYTHAKAQW